MSDHASIAAFDDEQLAAGLARRLSEEGFEATVNSDSAEQLLMFYNPHPLARFHIMVPGQKLEDALQWLNGMDPRDPVLSSAIRCPDCGSTRVEYPQFSRKTIVGSLLPSIAAALGVIERQFYCTTCQFMWSPKEPSEAMPPRKDSHASETAQKETSPATPDATASAETGDEDEATPSPTFDGQKRLARPAD